MWQQSCPGGRWCHLLISWRPVSPVFALTYPPIYRHCSHTQPYQTNGDVKRNEETELISDFLRLETERFSVQWVIALGPLPFDVRRRNDTNCISSLWNTISGWRDGEHIHLLTWSFKRRAPILIWRDSSASFSDKNQKGEEAPAATASPPRFRAGWFTDSLIPPRRGLSQEIRLKKWDATHNCNWNNIFVLCSLSEHVSIYSPRRWPELKFIHSSSSKVTFFFFSF